MRAPPPADLPYRIAWRSRSVRPGAHRSTQSGAGGLFRDLATLPEQRDPRRIDIRQSLRDPFGALHVRRFEDKSEIGVVMLLDVSGSMGFRGRSRKMKLAADLAAVLAASVRRAGDSFALYAADETVRDELTIPLTRSRASEAVMRAAIEDFVPQRKAATGLVEAVTLLGRRRRLVIVVSDFLMPEDQLEILFEVLSPHDVVPVRITDTSESAALPSWGLMELDDLETGRRRLVAMRPSLRAEWKRRSEARRSFFRLLSARYGREPFEIEDAIPWDRLAAHLAKGA